MGRWLLALVVCASCLALGSVHTPVLVACGVAGAVATALLFWRAAQFVPRPSAVILTLTALGLIAWTAVQAIPLPAGLVAAIAPANADVWARALVPLHEAGPTFTPLALDPIAAHVQILRGIIYLVTFLGALTIARTSLGVTFLERSLVVSAGALTVAAILHPVLGARKVMGLYEPTEVHAYDPHHLAPLLNTNHLAAYMNIGLLIAFGCLIERRASVPRPLAAAVVVVLGANVVWTVSRGGTAGMLFGMLVITMLTLRTGRHKRGQSVARVAVSVTAIVGGALILLSAFDSTRAKFANNNLFKLELVRNAFELTPQFPLFGIGRGAFESVFPSVRVGNEFLMYTHPENVIAQWVTEWGLPVGVIALLAILWALRPATMLARSRPPAGAWGALVAVGAQNLVDYSSELPGIVIAGAVCAAIVVGGDGGGVPSGARARWWPSPRFVAYACLAAVAVGVVLIVPAMGRELYNEERSLRDAALDRTLDRERFHDRAREAMLRHPAEAYLPFVGAVRATIAQDESVLPWAARAIERSPVYGRVHLLLARALFRRNPSQARLEYRLGCEQDSLLCSLPEVLPLVTGYAQALELVPEGSRGLAVLDHVTTRVVDRLPATVVLLDREIVARDPARLAPVRRAAAAVLADLSNGESWCAAELATACVADGIAAANRLRAAAPETCEGHALHAELRAAGGQPGNAAADLASEIDAVDDRAACLRRLILLARKYDNSLLVDASVERLVRLGCEMPECVDSILFAADVERSRGHTRKELLLRRRAWQRAPEREDILATIGREAEREGLHGEALEAYQTLADRHPEDKEWSAGIVREREAVRRGVLQRE